MSEEVMYKLNHGHKGFAINTFIISLINNSQAQYTTRNLLHSINVTKAHVQPFIVPATIPETIDLDIKNNFMKRAALLLHFLKLIV